MREASATLEHHAIVTGYICTVDICCTSASFLLVLVEQVKRVPGERNEGGVRHFGAPRHRHMSETRKAGLRCQYSYFCTSKASNLRTPETRTAGRYVFHADIRNLWASGVSICTFVLVKQVI